jgi:transcriptional regulator GlxA family with amidase domain
MPLSTVSVILLEPVPLFEFGVAVEVFGLDRSADGVPAMEHHYTASTLARRATMSHRTFARRFAAEIGTTPHKWLTQQRILAARSLLEETDLDVEQITTHVGFHSGVVMREHFRREIGLAPAECRRRFVPPRVIG